MFSTDRQSVVAPSGERLRDEGMYGMFAV